MEKNKTSFLETKLKKEKIESISVYYKGRKISELECVNYHAFKDKIFIFNLKDTKMKYVISKQEIDDILVIPFDNTIIILVLNNSINIEIKFYKEV